MTTHQDEIAKLRGTLEHIRAFIKHEKKYGDPTDANSSGRILSAIEEFTRIGLKTPRASKVVMVPIVGIPPKPGPDYEQSEQHD